VFTIPPAFIFGEVFSEQPGWLLPCHVNTCVVIFGCRLCVALLVANGTTGLQCVWVAALAVIALKWTTKLTMSTVGLRENFMTPLLVAVTTAEDGPTPTRAGLIVSSAYLNKAANSASHNKPNLQIPRCKVHVYYFHVLLTILLLKMCDLCSVSFWLPIIGVI